MTPAQEKPNPALLIGGLV